MVLDELSENIDENQYYNKHKVNFTDEKVNLHLRIPAQISNDITKIIAVYRDYGIDKKELSKSDLSAIIFKDFIDGLADDETAILNIFSKVKAFRDSGVA